MRIFRSAAFIGFVALTAACAPSPAEEDGHSALALSVVVVYQGNETIAGTYEPESEIIRLNDETFETLRANDVSLNWTDDGRSMPVLSAELPVGVMAEGNDVDLVDASGDVVGYLYIVYAPLAPWKPNCPASCPSDTTGWVYDGYCDAMLEHECPGKCKVRRNTVTGARCRTNECYLL